MAKRAQKDRPSGAAPRVRRRKILAVDAGGRATDFSKPEDGLWGVMGLRVDAELPLLCQRSLERFLFPVAIEQRLGLIRDEADEAALPPGYEALLMPEDGMLKPVELVEDELILAIPVIPVKPGTEAMEADWPASADEDVDAGAGSNPFAALAALKPDKN